MPMFFFQFVVRPEQTNPSRTEIAGAIVNCWIRRDTQAQAEGVARAWIADDGWRITDVEEATILTRETQNPEGMRYFEQAEIDGEVFYFHTWPVGAPDDTDAG